MNRAVKTYEIRMGLRVKPMRLMPHKKYNLLAASPDGIVGKYKSDGKTITDKVGEFLEVKCPYKRNIETNGEIKGTICSICYWIQIQLQVEFR